jgi:hypothetical protein
MSALVGFIGVKPWKTLDMVIWTIQTVKDITSMYPLKWWAHQDLNLGPKDYEQLQEIKPI